MKVIERDDIIGFDVKDVGSNTLQGCLAVEDKGIWTLRDIKGKTLVYNYANMRIGHDELAEDIHWLYAHGAKEVRLVRWIPAYTKYIGEQAFDVPRRRAERHERVDGL